MGGLGGVGSGGGVADRLGVDGGSCCDFGRLLCGWLGDGDTGRDSRSSRVVFRADVFRRVFWDRIHYMVVTVLGGHPGRGGYTSGRGQEH